VRGRSGGQAVSVGVLGPLAVEVGGVPARLPTEIPRTVLGALLLAEQPTSAAHLGTLLGAPGRPASRSTVQVAVSRLRSWLRSCSGDRLPVEYAEAGYLLRTEGAELDLDLDRFRGLVAAAEVRELPEQLELLSAALAVWRGDGLDDLPPERRDSWACSRLRRERLRIGADLAAAALRLGRPEQALPQLELLADLYPSDEVMQASTLRLLAASGRRAEALRRYEQLRQRLRDELGIDPAPGLRQTHVELLREDGAATGLTLRVVGSPRSAGGAAPAGRPVPRLLPPDIRDFVGRRRPLDRLIAELDPDRNTASAAIPIAAVAGAAGMGKTALAVRAAHRVRDGYPDGQLYVNLRRPDGEPVSVGSALTRFLRRLGVPAGQLPADIEERTDLFRSLLAGSRVLVVLDNAAGEGQIRRLLPGGPGTAVLVTSRRRMTALEGAAQLDLGPLAPGESVRLLAAVMGAERVAAEPAAAAGIAAACGYLPLALRIAGARLAARRHWALGDFAGLLADDTRRLDELRAADLDLRSSLSLSYRSLPADQRRALRLLGLAALPEVTGQLAAAVLGMAERDALSVVDQLVDARLVETRSRRPDQRVYYLSELVRLFAAERAAVEEPGDVQRAAMARVSAALSA
jgi:DNA-binding SARP family transcriptional activator